MVMILLFMFCVAAGSVRFFLHFSGFIFCFFVSKPESYLQCYCMPQRWLPSKSEGRVSRFQMLSQPVRSFQHSAIRCSITHPLPKGREATRQRLRGCVYITCSLSILSFFTNYHPLSRSNVASAFCQRARRNASERWSSVRPSLLSSRRFPAFQMSTLWRLVLSGAFQGARGQWCHWWPPMWKL